MSMSFFYPGRSLPWLALLFCLMLGACATAPEERVEDGASVPEAPSAKTERPVKGDGARHRESERRQAERLRQCVEEKRRLESSLQEAQKHADDLQKKLDSLLAIDRQLRYRGKARQ